MCLIAFIAVCFSLFVILFCVGLTDTDWRRPQAGELIGLGILVLLIGWGGYLLARQLRAVDGQQPPACGCNIR